MKQSPYHPSSWRNLIPDIDEVIFKMNQENILSVGITPFTRIIPAFFLKNYSIYTVKRSSDVDVMESYVRMHVLEDHHPEIADKIHGTGYLIGNYIFQRFLKSRRTPPKLMFYTMTEKIVQDLNKLGIPWLGNDPKTFEEVKYKSNFRKLLQKLGLPALKSQIYSRTDFLSFSFEALWKEREGAFVVQRGDMEVGGNQGTFFIHTAADFEKCLSILSKEESFQEVIVTPFVKGQSTSMLGCVMKEGILSGPLQLQLIDVPESLHEVQPNGIFFGNDIGFRNWNKEIEDKAQKVVEKIGSHLSSQGYKGIFGIDFLYDEKRQEIFPIECNPRFTGSLLLYSMMLLERKVPPLEFFHLLAHLGIHSTFDFEEVNNALKVRLACSHISFSPKGISKMSLPLLAGIYNYNKTANSLSYRGGEITLNDLKAPGNFLIIDTVPKLNQQIEQAVPRLFKFIFKRSISKSSYNVDEDAAFLVERFVASLKNS